LRLAVDLAGKPTIEGNQRHTGNERAGGHRNQISARKHAAETSHLPWGLESPLPCDGTSAHAAVKAALTSGTPAHIARLRLPATKK
jgi:hypothetical protein